MRTRQSRYIGNRLLMAALLLAGVAFGQGAPSGGRGGIAITGSPAANQVTLFNGPSQLKGDSKLTWNGTTFSASGTANAITLQGSSTGNSISVAATGSDTNIGVAVAGKGTGSYTWDVNKWIIDSLGNGTLAGLMSANTLQNANTTWTVSSNGAVAAASVNTGSGAISGGAISGTTGTFSGAVSTGALTPASVASTGAVSGTTGTFSGAVSTGTLSPTSITAGAGAISGGAISGTTGTFSGAVSGTTGTFTGAVSGTTGTFSSTLSGSNYSGTSSGTNTGDVTLGAVGSSPNANGASLSGQVLTLQPASATQPGVVTTGSQSFTGVKTLAAPVITGHGTIEGVTPTGATGTGNMVFSAAPTLTGHPTIEGVTSTGATGTGNMVFATSPSVAGLTDTGHPTIEGVTSTGASGTGKFIFDASPTFSSNLLIKDSGDANKITIAAPATQTAGWTLTLPTSAGSNTQVLTTNGSGTTSWATPSSGVSGSGTSGQVAVWNGSSSETGYTGLTSDSSGNLVANAISLGSNAAFVSTNTSGVSFSSAGLATQGGFSFNTTNTIDGSHNLFNVSNNGTNYLTVKGNGGGSHFEQIQLGGLPIVDNSGASQLIEGGFTNGATAIGVSIGNLNSLSTTGAKIFAAYASSSNNGASLSSEQLSVKKESGGWNLETNNGDSVPAIHAAQTSQPISIEYSTSAVLVAGAITVNFATAFSSAPACFCNDKGGLLCAATTITTSAVTLSGTGTDTVQWYCIGPR